MAVPSANAFGAALSTEPVMTREELKQAANSLPTEPGVYLMKDASDTVIYVG